MPIEWDAPEFEEHERHPKWYHISIVITLIVLAFAVWQRNILFAIFVVVAEVMVMVLADRAPRMVHFRMTEKGFAIEGGREYSFSDLESFSIRERLNSSWNKLVFHKKQRFGFLLEFFISKEDTERIRAALHGVLQEIETEESAIDNLQKLIRF